MVIESGAGTPATTSEVIQTDTSAGGGSHGESVSGEVPTTKLGTKTPGGVESEGRTGDSEEHRPEPGTEGQYSEGDKTQIETFMARLNLPKEITYFQDKSGALKFIIPVNGTKYSVSPEDVFKGFGLNQAGYQKLNEGKDLVNNVRDYFNQIKGNPDMLWDLAQRLGHDPSALAEKHLRAKIAEAQMTPEDRAQREKDARIARIEAENAELKAKETQREFQTLVEKEKARYDEELPLAMEKHGFKRMSPEAKSYVLERAVQKLTLANKAKRDLSCDDAVRLAKMDWQKFYQEGLGEIDENHILDMLPPAIIKAIRNADISKLKSSSGFGPSQPATGQEIRDLKPLKDKAQKKKSLTEYFESL